MAIFIMFNAFFEFDKMFDFIIISIYILICLYNKQNGFDGLRLNSEGGVHLLYSILVSTTYLLIALITDFIRTENFVFIFYFYFYLDENNSLFH